MLRESDMHIQGPQIHQFNNIAPQKIPRSAFKRDFTLRTTFNSDYLYPIFVEEIVPGDEVNLQMTAQVRMTTPLRPIMDNLYYETFFFFVPYRLVWDNWEKFQGQQSNPGDSVAYTIPILDPTVSPLNSGGFAAGSIFDYMEYPTLVSSSGAAGDLMAALSSLYLRGYNLCWNEWFRDQNLQNSLTVKSSDDGPDNPSIFALRKRGNRKDYFMSMLPWPQKGTAVSVPLGTTAPVISTGTAPTFANTGAGITARTMQFVSGSATNTWAATPGASAPAIFSATGLETNLASASAITINALRQFALYQQILELDARGGTRYVESIFARFGVISPDFRLQRPELIGQGSTRINVYSVPQTSQTSGANKLGDLAGFSATPILNGHGCRYSATEHGMILGVGAVRADLTYQQGIPKRYLRRTRLDFYEPMLNGMGEQAVSLAEVYAQGTAADDDVIGYQERFAEYRFRNSVLTGDMRSNAPLTQNIWHLGRTFASAPSLNATFIESTTPMDRVLAVNTATSPNFLMDAHFNYNHVRPMPIRSNPGIDRL